MILINSETLSISLSGNPRPVLIAETEKESVFSQDTPETGWAETELRIQGSGEIIWPNREGEIFLLEDAFEKLQSLDRASTGISICWPATASIKAVCVKEAGNIHTFSAEKDADGRAGFINISSAEPGNVVFRFTGAGTSWHFSSLRPGESSDSTAEKSRFIYQIGLVGPEGDSEAYREKGFPVLIDAAKAVIEAYGKPEPGDILHIFGYQGGHDRNYPDYSPSEALGGAQSFQKAIEAVKSLGFEISLYMNARLAELSRLPEYPELTDSILLDNNGRQVVESYRGRDFAVMNPVSSPWIAHLEKEARGLKALGADWLQLDQVAGRGAPVNPGEKWGAGYKELIEKIQSRSVKVWIQGVCDYYPADAFEATWRPVTVLPDGTLRGGFPLGIPDTTLLESGEFKGMLIIPEEKRNILKKTGLPVLYDRLSTKDVLPMWGPSWIESLKKNNYSRVPGEFNGGIQ